jgi:hypothetical protein
MDWQGCGSENGNALYDFVEGEAGLGRSTTAFEVMSTSTTHERRLTRLDEKAEEATRD